MIEKKNHVFEKSVLVGIINKSQNLEKVNEYLDELEFLTYTAGGEVFKRFVQRMDVPNPKTFIGSGKMEEVVAYVKSNEISSVILMTNSPLPNKKTLKKRSSVRFLIAQD